MLLWIGIVQCDIESGELYTLCWADRWAVWEVQAVDCGVCKGFLRVVVDENLYRKWILALDSRNWMPLVQFR